MPEIVSWLLAEPVRWLIPATFLSCVVGIPLMLWWERRKPSSYTRRRQREVLAPWLEMSTEAQRAHDNAVLAASDAALQIVLDDAERVGHLYVEPMSSASSD